MSQIEEQVMDASGAAEPLQHLQSAPMGMGDGRCPVCGGTAGDGIPIDGWGSWRVCQDCTLKFAWPLQLPEEPTHLFQDAYSGGNHLNGAKDFADRVRLREAIIQRPSLWFWTPAFEMTIQWLQEMLGDGRTVLEIGCGLGFMLHELRNRGFQVQGADVAKIAVDLNRREGFTVWHGNVDSIPEDVGDFDAVVSMFMLHHLPDPLGFVQRLRQRWPDAFLSITQYGPTNYDPVRTRPPRTLTRWNKQSLSKLLEIAGYETQVLELPSTGAEKKAFNTIQGSKLVHRILGKVEAPSALFQANMYFMNHLLPKIAGSLRMEAFVLQAFGRPQRG